MGLARIRQQIHAVRPHPPSQRLSPPRSKKMVLQSQVCCTDPVVTSFFVNNLGSRVAAFKEGTLDKLGEGGIRGKFGFLGQKKWQRRLFRLNEAYMCWCVRRPSPPDKSPPVPCVSDTRRVTHGVLHGLPSLRAGTWLMVRTLKRAEMEAPHRGTFPWAWGAGMMTLRRKGSRVKSRWWIWSR